MSETNQGYIDDFIEIETYIDNNRDSFETSYYTGVEAFFYEHLQNTLSDRIGSDKLNFYEFEIGDRIKVSKTQWAIEFTEKHDLPDSNADYDRDYLIENIKVGLFDKNPNPETGLPKLKISIYLRTQ